MISQLHNNPTPAQHEAWRNLWACLLAPVDGDPEKGAPTAANQTGLEGGMTPDQREVPYAS
jgi:hypothetical protein